MTKIVLTGQMDEWTQALFNIDIVVIFSQKEKYDKCQIYKKLKKVKFDSIINSIAIPFTPWNYLS